MRQSRFLGAYKTTRDGGLDYTYVGAWHETGHGAIWSSRVYREGALVGTPSGQMLEHPGLTDDEYVQAMIENCIEIRSGIA